MTADFCVYRFFDGDDQLLYIGQSSCISSRIRAHTNTSDDWHRVATIAIDRHPSYEAARAAERHAIATEQPLWNVRGINGSGDPAAVQHPVMKDTYRPLTGAIKWLIHERGLKQLDVAAAIGYNAEHFSRVVNGRDPLTFRFGSRLASELGVPWNIVMQAVEPAASEVAS